MAFVVGLGIPGRRPVRTLFSIALMFSVVVAAVAQMLVVGGAEITQSGIYELKATDSNNVAGTSRAPDYSFVSDATTVPARKGVNFGFEYRLTGVVRGLPVPIRHVVVFPEGGLRDPKDAKVVARRQYFFDATVGNLYLRGYDLKEDWELVPGIWTLQVWYFEKKLAEKTFTLIKPE